MLENPFPFFEEKRAHCPVFPVPSRSMYVVTRHKDLEFVLRNPDIFSSEGRNPLVNFPGQRYKSTPDLVSMDAPQHKQVRTVHQALLSPKRLREMRPVMEAEIHQMIDRFADKGEIEFINAVAKPFPAWVMGYILCLPREMHEQVDIWATEFFELFDKNLYHPNEGGPPQRLIDSYVNFMNYCGDLVADRRKNPQDNDPLTEFVNSRKEDGSLFSLDEMASYVRLLITGAQTSTSMLAQSLVEVIRMKDRGDLNDSKWIAKIVDESLRKDGAATYCPRIVTRDVELGGTALPAGARVYLSWHSANADETVFEEPYEFRPDRPNLAKNLGFGQGNHRCIGAPLAQLEGEVVLKALFTRFRDIRLSPKNDFKHDTSLMAMRVFNELHLELERADT